MSAATAQVIPFPEPEYGDGDGDGPLSVAEFVFRLLAHVEQRGPFIREAMRKDIRNTLAATAGQDELETDL